MDIENKDDEQIEVILDGENETPESEVVVEKAEEKAPESDNVDNTLQELRDKVEREKRARAEAERLANEARQEAHRYQSEALDSNKHLVINAIESVKQSNDILKANYRDAMASGDYEAAADFQTELASNAARLVQLEQGKQALESAPRTEAPKPYVSDPVEALASQLSPRSADWVRRHPEFATDNVLYGDMIEAHNAAARRGINPDTDEYFSFIERRLDVGGNTRAPEPEAKAPPRRTAPPAAPVTRSGTGASPNPNRVTLTAAEREIASMMGMTVEEYGKNKLALQREGKLN